MGSRPSRECRDEGVVPQPWRGSPDPSAAVLHALPHCVVSQILCPDVAAFLPPRAVKLRSRRDAQCCVTQLTWDGTAVSLEALASVGQLPLVVGLDFMGSSFAAGADVPAALGAMRNIERLTLNRCGDVDDNAVGKLASLPRLQALHLRGCSVGEPGMIHIRGMQGLCTLTLDGCNVDAHGLGHIQRLPCLRTLSLRRCDDIDVAAAACVGQMTNLQVLRLSGCQSLHAACIECLLSLVHLTELDLSACVGIDADGVGHAAKLPQLRTLDLSYCCDLRPTDLELLRDHPRLEVLTVKGIPGADYHLGGAPRLRIVVADD